MKNMNDFYRNMKLKSRFRNHTIYYKQTEE